MRQMVLSVSMCVQTQVLNVCAEGENVDMRLHRVIYNVIEEIESAMKGLLDPEFEEQVIGQVRQTFKVSKVGTIAVVMLLKVRLLVMRVFVLLETELFYLKVN